MEKLKNGCHSVNINHTETFPNIEPPKFGSPVFRVSMERDYQCRPLWKKWKMAAISLISIIWKNFQLLTPPLVWVSSSPSVNQNGISASAIMKKNCVDRNGISVDTGDANFLFSEFSIGSFSPITHPRLHFNIYAWLHLKHLCVDIYAWFTSHLCVVLHFLIFSYFLLHLFLTLIWAVMIVVLKTMHVVITH